MRTQVMNSVRAVWCGGPALPSFLSISPSLLCYTYRCLVMHVQPLSYKSTPETRHTDGLQITSILLELSIIECLLHHLAPLLHVI